MKLLSRFIAFAAVLSLPAFFAACADTIPEPDEFEVCPTEPEEEIGPEVCPDGSLPVRSLAYDIPAYPAPDLLEPDRAYLIASQEELEIYFPDFELEPVDFSVYSLLFVHGVSNSNCVYVGSDVWEDDGRYVLNARVYTGVATVMDRWNAARLVPVHADEIIRLEAEVTCPSFGESEWLEPGTVEIPVECNPEGMNDNEAVVISLADRFVELFGYPAEGIDFANEGLIFIKGTAAYGVEAIAFMLCGVEEGHYYGRVVIDLDDTAVMTPWNLALKLDRRLGWADIADISVEYNR